MMIKVSLSIHLGKRQIWVGDKVLGACDELIINVEEATPEELITLKNAREIKLIKPSRAENEPQKQQRRKSGEKIS